MEMGPSEDILVLNTVAVGEQAWSGVGERIRPHLPFVTARLHAETMSAVVACEQLAKGLCVSGTRKVPVPAFHRCLLSSRSGGPPSSKYVTAAVDPGRAIESGLGAPGAQSGPIISAALIRKVSHMKEKRRTTCGRQTAVFIATKRDSRFVTGGKLLVRVAPSLNMTTIVSLRG